MEDREARICYTLTVEDGNPRPIAIEWYVSNKYDAFFIHWHRVADHPFSLSNRKDYGGLTVDIASEAVKSAIEYHRQKSLDTTRTFVKCEKSKLKALILESVWEQFQTF